MKYVGLALAIFAATPGCAGSALDAPSPKGEAEELCVSTALYDFEVSGGGLEMYEGRKVMAVAIENDITVQPTVSARVVALTGKISYGAFSLSCPKSLSNNTGYPSYALYVDVNDDGKCDAGDQGFEMQLYGWIAPTMADIHTDSWTDIAHLGAPIGPNAATFCAGYFP
jgi:hypothetical protein